MTAGAGIVHAEMPLLWAKNADECIEGIVDLAALDPAKKSWLLVDWKTDRVAPGDVDRKSVAMSGPTFAPPTADAIRSC